MEIFDRMPWAAKDSVFRRLEEIGTVSAMTKEDRLEYDYTLKKYRDTLVVMKGAEMEGERKGRVEGQLNEKRDTVMRLRDMGLTINQIAQGAGMTVEEATALLNGR